jgi:hypothetical protein
MLHRNVPSMTQLKTTLIIQLRITLLMKFSIIIKIDSLEGGMIFVNVAMGSDDGGIGHRWDLSAPVA